MVQLTRASLGDILGAALEAKSDEKQTKKK